MLLLALAAATALRLDAAVADNQTMQSDAGNDLGDCFVLGYCKSDTRWFGKVEVAAVRAFADAVSATASVVIATSDTHLVTFGAGDVYSSTAHMSEDRDLQRYDDARITAGSLADGSAAAVIRFDWSEQDYKEGATDHGLDVIWRDKWRPATDVVVCSLGDTPACSQPVRVVGRPKVSLVKGNLRIGRARYTIETSP